MIIRMRHYNDHKDEANNDHKDEAYNDHKHEAL